MTERGGPRSDDAGELAKLLFRIRPHMLRHSAGYKLANEGMTRDRSSSIWCTEISPTRVRYTELSPDRFKGFWKD